MGVTVVMKRVGVAMMMPGHLALCWAGGAHSAQVVGRLGLRAAGLPPSTSSSSSSSSASSSSTSSSHVGGVISLDTRG
eukprot:CAMPEP_0167793900 /NCGR_PEP_ID=MMETSP0111_2-20121227/13491_1 /TAXON_ID=91324 /ORGANISM="Lotharella globosa, Strain CCCM811" /LENGTH=77 /DNA_ID=CAMNT_0007687217 /DNA_START=220 /DNA_END=451 /DNA_ORIENTATION=-